MSKGKKINTHTLLAAYHHHPEYPQIAHLAGGMSRISSEEEILEAVQAKFGQAEALPTMLPEPRPIAVFGELGVHIPQNAYDQLVTSLRVPPATRGAIMPDAHYGYSVPIGAVVELENAISPAYIGYDISCMVMISVYVISQEDFMAHRKDFASALRAETAFGVDSRLGIQRQHTVMEDPLWEEIKILKTLKGKAQSQLGSSGGGNHFADLVLGETISQAGWFSHRPGEKFVALITHSGSRGTGHRIATNYVKHAEQETKYKAAGISKGYGWLDMDKDCGREYWAAMQLMGRYALANHELIHAHFAKTAGLETVSNYWNRHNFAWENDGLYVHRKGATPAELDRPGIIPGTSGTYSYLVNGLGNAESLYSSSHGAGRPYSRTEAKKRHNKPQYEGHMSGSDILHYGIAADETYQAYKDIETVLDVQDGVLVDRVARLEPKVVLMGGHIRSDDGE